MASNSSTLASMPGHRRNKRAAVCAVVLFGLLTGAGEAAAQSDGVFVDPDTPAGKEYALPLDKARQDVAPNSAPQGSEQGDTELFGAGISKKGGGGGQAGGAQTGTDGGDRAKNETDRGGSDGMAGVDPRSVAKAAASGGSGISAGWLTALIAFGVLVVGGAAGLSLRALRSA
jgi:hypothetical protein